MAKQWSWRGPVRALVEVMEMKLWEVTKPMKALEINMKAQQRINAYEAAVKPIARRSWISA